MFTNMFTNMFTHIYSKCVHMSTVACLDICLHIE